MIPKQVGPYTVLSELGRGGMGVVLRARHPRLPNEVAIKLIRADVLDDEALERFKAEVLALARIQHPNVVPVLDSGRAADGSPYYVMPLVPGRSLAQVLSKDGPLAPERAAGIVQKLALALETAHVQAAVIHRDLKPANVLIEDGTGEPRLLDFGLAKRSTALGASHEGPRTETGAVLGTPDYMAPEQAEGIPGLVDARTDVYGLGAVLYALLTGAAPHPSQGRSLPQALADVLLTEPVPVTRLAPGTPRDLAAICRQAMAKAKERRYVSARELALDLGRFLAHEPVRARPPGRWARVQRLLARNSVAVLALLAVSTVLSAFSAWQAVRASRALEREHEALAREKQRALDDSPSLALGQLQELHEKWQSHHPFATATDPAVLARAASLRDELERIAHLADTAPLVSQTEAVVSIVGVMLADVRYLDDALERARKATDLFPRSFRALGALHLVQHLRRESCADVRARVKALALEEKTSRSEPVAIAVALEEALTAGDFEAVRAIEREAKIVTNDTFLILELARCSSAFDIRSPTPALTRTAIAQYDLYLQALQNDSDVMGERWLFAFELGTLDFDGGREKCLKAVEVDPRCASALVAHALSDSVRLDRDGALDASRRALEVAPGAGLAHLARARAFLLAERFAESLDEADRALESRADPRALTVRGYALLGLDREDEALVAFARATSLGHPTTADANVWADRGRRWVIERRGMAAAEGDALQLRIQESESVDLRARDPLFALRLAEECARKGNRAAAIEAVATLVHMWNELTTTPLPVAAMDLCTRLGVKIDVR